jgi:Zn-finger nucleic acid-binding protein
MQAFNYGADTGIILDKCDRCGGIWLDGGELEKVQVAVEAADEALASDFKRFAGRLHEEEVRQDAKEQEANRASRAPLVAAFMNQVLDADDQVKG